jgi:hypothetical protein
MKINVLIAGAGQLGSRHLQGLAKSQLPLNIHVYDISRKSLLLAGERWRDVEKLTLNHNLTFHDTIDGLPKKIDCAIVATNADVRPTVVHDIAHFSSVKYWVLEKVLAQSQEGISQILRSTLHSYGSWVNTPRRIMPWYQNIKFNSGLLHPTSLKVRGGYLGLACNAVHFLDLFSWLSGESLIEVDTSRLESHFYEAKRIGNWEIFGTLQANFSGGGYVEISSTKSLEPITLEISDSNSSWTIAEINGLAKNSDGREILGAINLQSEMSASILESIVANGKCGLPSLDQSASLHTVYINSMLKHWQDCMDSTAVSIPIT